MEEQEKFLDASGGDPLKENANATIHRIPMYQILFASPIRTKIFFAIATLGTWTFIGCLAFTFYLITQLLDEMTDEEEDDYDYYHEAVKMCSIVYGLAFLVLIGCYLGVFFFVRVGQDIAGDVRHRYFQAMIAKDIEFYDTHSKSSLEVPQHMNRCCEI